MLDSLLLQIFKDFNFRLKNEDGRLFSALCVVSRYSELSDAKLPNDSGRVSTGFPSRDKCFKFVSFPKDSGRLVRELFTTDKFAIFVSDPKDSGSEVSLL